MVTPHTVAKTLIINNKGQALVLKRAAYYRHPERAHQPDLPGGLVDSGETMTEAAVREIEEETGIIISVESLELVFSKIIDGAIQKYLYMTKLKNTPEVKLSYEHESYQWVPIAELLETYTFTQFYEEGIRYGIDQSLI